MNKASVAPQNRIHITYRTVSGDEKELPLKLMMLGDYTGLADDVALADCNPVRIDKDNFDEVMRGFGPAADITVPNILSGKPGDKLALSMRFPTLSYFKPDELVRQVPDMRELVELREALGSGTEQRGDNDTEHKARIAEIDRKLSAQLDEILHHPKIQKLESAWRGLKLVVDRTDFRENTQIVLLNASKEALESDFERSPEIMRSGLHKHVYTAEYGVFGGEPFAAIIANYEFGPNPRDIALLQKVAAVSVIAHTPCIAAAGPEFFDIDTFPELPSKRDLKAIMEGPRYIRWRLFRDSEDSRYVGLTLPRFLLRLPYGSYTNPVRSFDYQERVSDSHDHHLWGNTAFAFATRLVDSFAKYRWCPNIIGLRSGGSVEDLPMHRLGTLEESQTKIPTEIRISERNEYELAEEGFIVLATGASGENAAFFSANSVRRPRHFEPSAEGRAAEISERLATQLPYLFVITRLAHYVKVLYHENSRIWTSRSEIEFELNKWINRYTADMEIDHDAPRAPRPLLQAGIEVSDAEHDPACYRLSLWVRPLWKCMGTFFTLHLKGNLDKTEIPQGRGPGF